MQSNQTADKPLGYIRVSSGNYDAAKTLLQLIQSASPTSVIPDGTYRVLIQPETQNARYRDDGGTPTTSVGLLLVANTIFDCQIGRLSSIQMISAVAGGVLHLNFYGAGV